MRPGATGRAGRILPTRVPGPAPGPGPRPPAAVPQPLAREVAAHLGLELGDINIKQFADGETYVQLQESIRGGDVFLIQPTCPPTNDALMEMLIMIDACKRASARNMRFR